MKKLTLIVLSACILSIIFAGCTRTPTLDVSETVLPPRVSLILEKTVYSVGEDAITGVLKNDTDMKFLRFYISVFLEKKTDGKWEKIDIIKDPFYMPLGLFYLYPHSQIEWGFSISDLYGHLETGSYRVSTLLYDLPPGVVPTTMIPGNLGNFSVSAEFEMA